MECCIKWARECDAGDYWYRWEEVDACDIPGDDVADRVRSVLRARDMRLLTDDLGVYADDNGSV